MAITKFSAPRKHLIWIMAGCLMVLAASASAQQTLDLAKVTEILDRDGHIVLKQSNVLVSKFDFTVAGDTVEAITFRPTAEGKYPGLLLIPGFSRTARDFIPIGIRFAKEGFACLAMSERGFGRSQGDPDFVGPKTMAGVEAAFRKLRAQSFVDSARMGVYGYSRGAMAASLLAVRLTPAELKAAVFGAGVYDFRKAYEEVKLEGIRENMRREAGLSDAAVDVRTSVTKMSSLPCPVLILHGAKDENVPVSQAYLLRDTLTELKKPFEVKIFPDASHSVGPAGADLTLAFFKRELMPAPAAAATSK